MSGSRPPAWGLLRLLFLYVFVAAARASDGFASRPRLSDLTLLLPAELPAAKYRLHGYSGCFSWASNNEALVRVQAEHNATVGCSTSALVWAVGAFPERRATAVVARERASGAELRCDVFVDRPASLQIRHHSLRLFLGDLADLRVLGFDAEGNVFSTLDGARFHWELKALPGAGAGGAGGADGGSAAVAAKGAKAGAGAAGGSASASAGALPPPLTNVLLDATSFKPSAAQLELERSGHGADVHVVSATAIGRAEVTARLTEPALLPREPPGGAGGGAAQQAPPLAASLVLSVAERVQILPAPAPLLLPPLAALQLALWRPRPVDAPADAAHFRWRPLPADAGGGPEGPVLSVDERSGLVISKTYGTIEVAAEDLRINAVADGTVVVVARPEALTLTITPEAPLADPRAKPAAGAAKGAAGAGAAAGPTVEAAEGRWPLVAGRSYLVSVVARDPLSRKFLLTNESAVEGAFGGLPAYAAEPAPPAGGVAAGGAGRHRLRALVPSDGGTLSASLAWSEPPADPSLNAAAVSPAALRRGPARSLRVTMGVQICPPVRAPVPGCDQASTAASGGCVLRLPFALEAAGRYALEPTGGCPGGYKFALGGAEPPAAAAPAAAVSAAGVVRAAGVGEAAVVAAAAWDLYEGHNAAELRVQVSAPADAAPAARAWGAPAVLTAAAALAGRRGSAEVAMGDSIELWLILRSAGGELYHNCSAFGALAAWSLARGGEAAAALAPLPVPAADAAAAGVCGAVTLRGTAAGWAQAKATLSVDGKPLEVSWEVAVFAPLRAVCSGDEPAGGCGGPDGLLVAIGSGVEVALAGGPTGTVAHAVRAAGALGGAADKAAAGGLALAAQAGAVGSPGRFRATCVRPGEFSAQFWIGASPEAEEGVAADGHRGRAATVRVRCALPAAMAILVGPSEVGPAGNLSAAAVAAAGARGAAAAAPRPVVHGRRLGLAALALDASGRVFTHADSLQIAWEASGPRGLALAPEEPPMAPPPGPFRRPRGVELGPGLGRASVRVAATGLRPAEAAGLSAAAAAAALPASAAAALAATAELDLVAPLRLSPAFALLYDHAKAQLAVTVAGGTRQLSPLPAAGAVGATLSQSADGSYRLLLSPACAAVGPDGCGGRVGVRDVATGEEVLIDAAVARLASLTATAVAAEPPSAAAAAAAAAVPAAAVALGAAVGVRVRAADARGRPFESSQLAYMDLRARLSDGRLAPAAAANATPGAAAAKAPAAATAAAAAAATAATGAAPSAVDVPFDAAGGCALRGAAPGPAVFSVSGLSGRGPSAGRVESGPVRVLVSAPLAPHPAALLMAPGADYVLTVAGGPGPGAGMAVAFASSDPAVAIVAPGGRITATAPGDGTVIATGTGPLGEALGAASVRVSVRNVEGARIAVAGRTVAGRAIAAHVTALPEGLDPVAFGQVCFGYKWSIEDPVVFAMHAVHPAHAAHTLGGSLAAAGGAGGALGGGADGAGSADGGGLDVGFGVRLFALQPGETTLSVSFTCRVVPAPAAGAHASHNASAAAAPGQAGSAAAAFGAAAGGEPKLVRFSASKKLSVLPPLGPGGLGTVPTWVLPPRYTTPPLLPVGPTYSLLQAEGGASAGQAVAGVSSDGRLTTGAALDVACVRAVRPAEAPTAGAEVAACVRVAVVAQLALEAGAAAPPPATGAAAAVAPPALPAVPAAAPTPGGGGPAAFPGFPEGRSHFLDVPVGSVAAFDLLARDELGALFGFAAAEAACGPEAAARAAAAVGPWLRPGAAGGVALSVDTNRADVIEVDVSEGRLSLRAVQRGSALLRLRLTAPGAVTTVAYAAVRVGSYILPFRPRVAVGGAVSFALAGAAGEAAAAAAAGGPGGGRWQSDDPGVLAIDPATGEARAVAEGSTVVRFHGGGLETFSDVEVVSVARVDVSPPAGADAAIAGGAGGAGGRGAPGPVVSNSPGAPRKLRFDVSFSDAAGRPLADGAGVAQRVRFACSVRPAGLARPMPGLDRATGRAYCDVDLAAPSEGGPAAAEGLQSLEVVATAFPSGLPPAPPVPPPGGGGGAPAAGAGAGAIEGAAHVPFAAGFEIAPGSPVRPPLALSPGANRSSVLLAGNVRGLRAVWGEHDVLDVTLEPDAAAGPSETLLVVALKSDAAVRGALRDRIVLIGADSGQRLELPVSVAPARGGRGGGGGGAMLGVEGPLPPFASGWMGPALVIGFLLALMAAWLMAVSPAAPAAGPPPQTAPCGGAGGQTPATPAARPRGYAEPPASFRHAPSSAFKAVTPPGHGGGPGGPPGSGARGWDEPRALHITPRS